MPSVLRIIDANANRAREAIRVMEDAARFILDDAELTDALKTYRHELATVLVRFGDVQFERDTPGDVGRTISTPQEQDRSSVGAVTAAAGKRLGEALRSIEEYGKMIDSGLAMEVERFRYEGYVLDRRLADLLGAGRIADWRICVLLTEALCSRPWHEVAKELCAAEPDCIQLRENSLSDRELLSRAHRLMEMRRSTAIVINDRPDVAMMVGADGVHLGQRDLPCSVVRRQVGGQLLIGVSTSELEQAEQALRDGADFCGVGPMFPTATKPERPVVGPAYLAKYLRWGRLPHLAIGGITPDNIGQLVDAGCRGVAVSGAVCSAQEPGAVVEQLRKALPSATASPPVTEPVSR
jgi:thiamine-phosphate pyrophosphorylase